MKVLIDGDIFRYRCAFAAERTKYLVELINASGHKEYSEFDNKKDADAYAGRVTKGVSAVHRLWSRKDLQPLENCLQIVKSSLENALEDICREFKVETVEHSIWLSGKTNFRTELAKTATYKGNREEIPKPHYYKDVGAYLVETWDATYTEGIEADDAIGIAAMESKANQTPYIVVSNDKDLRQIPGNHYNWVTKEFATVSPKEAKFQLFSQILSGDPTDNVPGLQGIGPATAAKILEGAQSPEDMVDSVVSTYILEFETYPDKYPKVTWLQYLKEQWALVYILKHKDESWAVTREGEYFLNKYG